VAHRPAELNGKKLLIDFVHSYAFIDASDPRLVHGFDHVHLDLGYFGTKGLSYA